jgi:hypothetical protein
MYILQPHKYLAKIQMKIVLMILLPAPLHSTVLTLWLLTAEFYVAWLDCELWMGNNLEEFNCDQIISIFCPSICRKELNLSQDSVKTNVTLCLNSMLWRYVVNGGIVLNISNFCTEWHWVVSFIFHCLTLKYICWCFLYMKLSGCQSQSGCIRAKEIVPALASYIPVHVPILASCVW